MARKPKTEPTGAMPQLEAYTLERKRRSEIKGAPYNPRKISDSAKAKLQAILAKLKLLAPLTWNRRTGNLVGGHQRLSRLDAIVAEAGFAGADYELTYAVVDLSAKEEIEANLALNNLEAQGDWDLDQLGAIFRDHKDLDLEATGFDAADIYQTFGDSPLIGREDNALDAVADKFRERVTAQTEHIQGKLAKERDDVDFYLVAVFRSREERNAFSKAVGLEVDDNKWVDGKRLQALLQKRGPGG